jgi:nucleoside-diphosphate-sugar epimerase
MGLTDVPIHSAGQTWRGDMPWYADIRKVRQLGFAPSVELPTGIARTIEWIKSLRS